MIEIFTLLFILIVGWSGRLIFERFRLPPVVGEILAGMIVGPSLLGLVGGVVKGVEVTGLLGEPVFEWTRAMDFLATLGMFFLMFQAGLATDPKRLWKRTRTFLLVGSSGTFLPLFLGFLATWVVTGDFWASLLVGIAISGTAMVTKVRMLEDLDLLRTEMGYTMMGSSVIDNLLSFIFLSVVVRAVMAGAIGVLGVGFTVLLVVAFFFSVTFLGRWLYPKLGRFLSRTEARGFALALCFGLLIAGIAHLIGIHLIIGAYLAGLFIREELREEVANELYEKFYILSHGFLGPVFMVSVAFHVDFGVFVTHPLFLLLVMAAAISGKVVGVALSSYASGFRKDEALVMGWGMNSRGVVEMILAMVGLEIGVLTDVHVSVLVFTAIVTTLLAPVATQYYLKRLNPKR